MPEPPGPVRVRSRAPSSIAREHLAELFALVPTKELAGRGRFVFEIVFSGGKDSTPSWKIDTASGDVLQPMLAEVEQDRAL